MEWRDVAWLAVHICGLNWTVLLGNLLGFSKGTGVLLGFTPHPSTLTVFTSLPMAYTYFINFFPFHLLYEGLAGWLLAIYYILILASSRGVFRSCQINICSACFFYINNFLFGFSCINILPAVYLSLFPRHFVSFHCTFNQLSSFLCSNIICLGGVHLALFLLSF